MIFDNEFFEHLQLPEGVSVEIVGFYSNYQTTSFNSIIQKIVSSTVTYTAFKESGFDREAASQDCQSRGETLANVYSEAEQQLLNQAIVDVGGAVVGDERAFWLGMKEDTSAFGDGTAVGSSHLTPYTTEQQDWLKEHTTVRIILKKTDQLNRPQLILYLNRILMASLLVMTVGTVVMLIVNHNHQML